MTGGFGTVLGIIIGAFIFGIAKEAFFYILELTAHSTASFWGW